MISKNLYFNIILFSLCITLTAVAGCYFTISKSDIFAGIFTAFLLTIENILLIRYLNKTNRRLAYFVDSIQNEDTSVKFPQDIKHGPTVDLYNSLNVVNDIIRDVKVKSEYRENLLNTLIEYSFTGFITIDQSGNFEVMNNSARKYLGVQHTSNLKRLEQSDKALYTLITTLAPGKTKVHHIQREGEHFNLSVSTTDIIFYDQKFKIVSLQDISKELDKQELESWHKLFRVITHEIMNSIAPITSLSNTLLKMYRKDGKSTLPNEIDEQIINQTILGLKSIDDMGNGLKNFVENYRQLSKLPKPKISKIDLKKWLENQKLIIQEMLKDQDIILKITLSNDCKIIHGDEQLLNQVMLNLTRNAIDALQDIQSKEILINVSLAANGKTLISVKDSGCGISANDLDKLFIPFYTTKENGNGIGLSLSKQIISLHGGSINVKSKEKEGCEVLVLI